MERNFWLTEEQKRRSKKFNTFKALPQRRLLAHDEGMSYSTALPENIRCLMERTTAFARNVRRYIGKMPRTLATIDDMKQLLRSSGSVAANYREAIHALSPRDRVNRMKICRKESDESKLWLELLKPSTPDVLEGESDKLEREAEEFVLIFSAIVRNILRKETQTATESSVHS